MTVAESDCAYLEELANETGTVTEVLLDKLTSDYTQEGGRSLVGDCLGEQGLSGTGSTVENDTLGRLDTHLLVELGVQQGQLDRLSDFLDLCLQTTNVGV